MQISSSVVSKIQFLTADLQSLEKSETTPVKAVFDESVIEFFDALSKELMHDVRSRQYSDVIAYAFWVRKASLLKVKESFTAKTKLGRGVGFHIAPSNVPINFAVSMTSSLLAGNVSIVRVSNKDFEQVKIVIEAINKLLASESFAHLKDYVIVVRYDRDKDVNDFLSSICDVRIVWGGNATVGELRLSPIPPRAIEMTFPDRYSIALINSDEYLNSDKKIVAQNFYIDTYFTDQNACSSPRLVVWTGNKVKEAQDCFYKELKALLNEKYQFSPILAIDKLNAFCELAIAHNGVKKIADDNVLVRVELPEIFDDLMNFKLGGGYFFDYVANDLNSIVKILKKPCQTISYLGIEPQKIKDLVVNNGVRGVDRIVPLGKTMELEFYWDGYNMIDAMSRYLDLL